VRGGPHTQELIDHLSERLRLAAGLLLFFTAGLVVWRAALEDLVRATVNDFAWPHWPARGGIVTIGAPMLLAILLRLAFVNQPMRYDEALTFNEFASRPIYYALSFYPDPNNHLLNTLLAHLAFITLGNQPWVLRLPALASGVLLVPATYALSRLLYGQRPAAFLAALLVAGSSYLVEYSTNSRGYTLQALCFVVLLCLVTLAIERDSPSALLLAALVAGVGFYALPTMLYGVVIAAVWFGILPRKQRLVRIGASQLIASALVLGLVVVLTYTPVIVVSGADKLVANRFVVPLEVSQLPGELTASLERTWAFWNRDIVLPVAGVLLIGFGVASLDEVRARRRVPLGVLAPTLCLAMVLIQRVAPFERVWLFLLPLYLAIASAGVVKLGPGRWSNLVAGLASVVAFQLAIATLIGGSILRSSETGTFADAEAVARSLRGRLAAGDAVLTTLPASLPELQYYFPKVGLPIDSLVRPAEEAQHLYVVSAPDDVPTVPGWGGPEPIQRFSGSVVLAFQRT
jgi:4-amino-4-deoxy-L-arabinose transferase-like glycosyltransferase